MSLSVKEIHVPSIAGNVSEFVLLENTSRYQLIKIKSIGISLTTDATAANRIVRFTLVDKNENMVAMAMTKTQVASNTYYYVFSPIANEADHDTVSIYRFPREEILPYEKLKCVVVAGVAGDVMNVHLVATSQRVAFSV